MVFVKVLTLFDSFLKFVFLNFRGLDAKNEHFQPEIRILRKRSPMYDLRQYITSDGCFFHPPPPNYNVEWCPRVSMLYFFLLCSAPWHFNIVMGGKGGEGGSNKSVVSFDEGWGYRISIV